MKLIDYNNPASWAYRFRQRRMKWLVELVRFVVCQGNLKEVKICDVGGTAAYWQSFPFEDFHNIVFHIDLINLEYPDYDQGVRLPDHVILQKLHGNACDLCEIQDANYHVAHSNSVIEHVGGWQQIEKMARELQRVSRYYFIQTPDYWFPVEPHFLIPFYAMLPRPIRVWLQLHVIGETDYLAAIREDDAVRLLTRKEMNYLLPKGEVLIERFFGFSKSIVVRSPCKSM